MSRLLVPVAAMLLSAGLSIRHTLTLAGTPQADARATATYVGAGTCRTCHEEIYLAWNRTKHAHALDKLGRADREGGRCIRCHVTGSAEMIAADGGKPSLPGVQCESCHGPGGAHVDAAKAGDAGNARTARIDEDTCLRCHNTTSPHYKPFFFAPMKNLVHRRSAPG